MIITISGILAYLASRNPAIRQYAARIAQKVSSRGFDLIKSSEGYRSRAYKDITGKWTIGYGILLDAFSPLINGPGISEPQAAQMLKDYIDRSIDPVISKYVKVPLTQNQYDALASWLYNFSEDHFRKSTLLRKLNARDYQGAADEFLRWDNATVDGVFGPVFGLTERRKRERTLFLT